MNKYVNGIVLTAGLLALGACATHEKGSKVVVQPLSGSVSNFQLSVSSKGDELGKRAEDAVKVECPEVLKDLGEVSASSKNTLTIDVTETEKVGGFAKYAAGTAEGDDVVKITATLSEGSKVIGKVSGEGRVSTANLNKDSFALAAKRACQEIVNGFKGQ